MALVSVVKSKRIMQSITITIEFKVNHTPGTEEHLKQIAENYFRPKGIELKDGVIKI